MNYLKAELKFYTGGTLEQNETDHGGCKVGWLDLF